MVYGVFYCLRKSGCSAINTVCSATIAQFFAATKGGMMSDARFVDSVMAVCPYVFGYVKGLVCTLVGAGF